MRKFLVLFYCLVTFATSAQTKFDRVLNIPVQEGNKSLRFPWAGGINFPWISSIDLNADGLKDLFLFDHHNDRILTFLNNGNSNADLAWNYAPDFSNQFPPVSNWVFLYDYNCDGKADFFTLSSARQCAGIAVYKNISSGNNLRWAIVDSCLQRTFVTTRNNIFANSISLPNFNDVDGDGDMDILGYNSLPDGRILYYKNHSIESYSVCDSLDFILESLCYGNFQLKIGGTNTVGCFQCPCRVRRPLTDIDSISVDPEVPPIIFPEPVTDQSEAARRDDTVSSIFSMDVDGDGFKELFVGDIASSNTLMIHNAGTEMDAQDTLFPSYDSPAIFNGFHYHAYIDVDNDGLNDFIVMPNDHENKLGIWYYKNLGTNASPVFTLESNSFLQNNMIDVGEDACPVFFDYDGDNLLDLVISKAVFNSVNGVYKSGLYLYKNIGTTTVPSFNLITEDFAGLTATGLYVSPTYPAFGDLDGDGDKDMIIGLEDGQFHYYQNNSGPGNPASFTGPTANYMMIDVGKFATPQLFDLNHDGLLDLISGGQRGFINYYQNLGTTSSPIFNSVPTNDTLGCIVLQGVGTTDGFTVPFFYDSLGFTRLLVASENGNINQYDNIDGNLNGCFNLAGNIYNTPESSRIKFNITVNGGDLNGDNLTDIIIGQSTGGAEVRYQHNPFSGIPESVKIKPTFEVFPIPVNDEMIIRFYHLDNSSSVLRVYNSIGEVVKVKLIKEESTELKTSSWNAGIYFLQFTSGDCTIGRKVIVGH